MKFLSQSSLNESLNDALASTDITRYWVDAPPARQNDWVAREEPLEIRIQGRSIAVTMRTPGDDEELACHVDVLLIDSNPGSGVITQRGEIDCGLKNRIRRNTHVYDRNRVWKQLLGEQCELPGEFNIPRNKTGWNGAYDCRRNRICEAHKPDIRRNHSPNHDGATGRPDSSYGSVRRPSV